MKHKWISIGTESEAIKWVQDRLVKRRRVQRTLMPWFSTRDMMEDLAMLDDPLMKWSQITRGEFEWFVRADWKKEFIDD